MKEGIAAAGFPREKIAVIPNACDFDLFAANPEDAEKFLMSRPHLRGRPILLYPGSFGIANGLGYAVELAAALRAIGSDVAILLVGNGKQKHLIRDQAHTAGVLGVNLFIEDAVPKEKARDMFGAATCIAVFFAAIPELGGNSANKFFDALAAVKPVVLNFNGWMTELIRERDFGLDLHDLSLPKAAQLINSKLHDPKWLAKASKEAAKVGVEYFARDTLVAQLETILKLATQDNGKLAEGTAPGMYVH